MRVAPHLAQQVELGLTADERRTRVELGRQRLGFQPRRIELRILAQDRVVQLAQRGSGLDADLLDERGSRLPVGLQRLRLASRAVQREHPLRLQPFAQRVAGDEHLELCEDLAMAARRQVAVDRTFGRGQVQLLEPADLAGRERLPRDVGQRRPAPQRERLARQVVRDERREAQRIDVAVAEAQLVPAPAGDDLRAVAAGCQRLANLRDVELHHLGRRGRRILAPERLDESLARHRRALVEGQHGQQRPRLAPADGHRAAVGRDLHRTEDADLHVLPRLDAVRRRYSGSEVRTSSDLPAFYRCLTGPVQPPRIGSAHPEEVVMKSHRQFVRRLRRLAIGLVAIGALVSVERCRRRSRTPAPRRRPATRPRGSATRRPTSPAPTARPASLSSRPRGSATRRPTSPARAARPTYRRRRSRSSGPRPPSCATSTRCCRSRSRAPRCSSSSWAPHSSSSACACNTARRSALALTSSRGRRWAAAERPTS